MNIDQIRRILDSLIQMAVTRHHLIFNIGRIRCYLTKEAWKTLVSALVTSNLDNGNCLYFGVGENIGRSLIGAKYCCSYSCEVAETRTHISDSGKTPFALVSSITETNSRSLPLHIVPSRDLRHITSPFPSSVEAATHYKWFVKLFVHIDSFPQFFCLEIDTVFFFKHILNQHNVVYDNPYSLVIKFAYNIHTAYHWINFMDYNWFWTTGF